MELDPHVLHVAIRWLHVAAMATAFGAGLLGPATNWGTTLLLKLGSVLALVLLSLPRTLAVARISALSGPSASGSITTIRNLYGATTGAFAVILALAVWLAHG